ncbi:YihY/virulence factor BrkB family protein [Loktanella sp. TSTF-M6]|uniref:YihY/virulence factor BrkB family protein n=1 Tax=Loktanella gaetbuli TaxID=2881335 RepID=A0ABS8BR66_9RHOB|nr:YihY/virulence factor BrkB family protein [Loktanella gaetbuli]MCB5198206.1 YihY/virulence factor BrkB family protein [Loktanella gaetbuli]
MTAQTSDLDQQTTPKPPRGRLRRVVSLLWAVWQTASERHISLIAGGVAFFSIFALFPAAAAIISLFGLIADPVVVVEQLELMQEIIPEDTYLLLTEQMSRLLATRSDKLGFASVVSLLLAVWAARLGVAGLMSGLNAIAGRPARNGFKQIVVALTLTVSLVALALVAMVAVVLAPIFIAFAPIANDTAWLLEGIRWLVALVVLYSALSILYRFGPNQRGARLRWMTVGAGTVVILWIAASVMLSYYLGNFARYNEVYGSIGAVIGMLLWLYITAFLILLGAALNLHVHGNIDGKHDAPDATKVSPPRQQ